MLVQGAGAGAGKRISLMLSLLFTIDLYPKNPTTTASQVSPIVRNPITAHPFKYPYRQPVSQSAIHPSIPTSIQIHLVCVIYFLHVFSDLRHRVDRMTAADFVYPDEAGDGNSPHSTATSHMLHETLSMTWFTEEWGMKSGISCIYTQYQRATLHGPRRGSLFSI